MKKFWIVNKINSNSAEILLYGYISQYDVSSADFIIELSQLAAVYNDIKIRINSGGGSVVEGIAIYNAIRGMVKSGKNITTSVDGIAASMAGVIAMAGSKVHISKYGRIMTHRARGYAEGDVDEIRNYATMMEGMENDLAAIFAERTGLAAEEVKVKLMKAGVDNWMNCTRCIEMKLADEIYDADPVPVPENITDEKQLHNIFETCLNKSISNSQNTNMKEIAKLLGLAEDASEAQIEAATKKLVDAKKAAEDAVATAAKSRAESLVNDAISAKKITADKKETFVSMAISNFDAAKTALDLIPSAQKPNDVINRQNPQLLTGNSDDEETPEVTAKAGEGWDKLFAKGVAAVAECKKNKPDVYAKLYKDKYHRDPSAMGLAQE